jgi:hypothetical protein
MVVIVLMGQAAPKVDKGKGKEGEVAMANVKLGRYACLVELLTALSHIEGGKGKDKALRTFIDTVESRLSVMLEAEVSIFVPSHSRSDNQEKLGSLPGWYRALLCRLFYASRSITLSVRKSAPN